MDRMLLWPSSPETWSAAATGLLRGRRSAARLARESEERFCDNHARVTFYCQAFRVEAVIQFTIEMRLGSAFQIEGQSLQSRHVDGKFKRSLRQLGGGDGLQSERVSFFFRHAFSCSDGAKSLSSIPFGEPSGTIGNRSISSNIMACFHATFRWKLDNKSI